MAILKGRFKPYDVEIIKKAQSDINQKFLDNTCKTPFFMIYYKHPQGGGDCAPRFSYHHLIADIKAAIATTALIINSAISMVVSLFAFFILSLLSLTDVYIITYCL